MKPFNNRGFITKYIAVSLALVSAGSVHAATMTLLPKTSSVSVGDIVSVRVAVNTEGVVINNAEGVVQFPTDMLDVVSVTKSASIFSLWVEEPNFSNITGRMTFNGGIPNPGYTGQSGTIASITFRAKKAGTASVIFSDGAIRANDGLGTDVMTAKNNCLITIGNSQSEESTNDEFPVEQTAAKGDLPPKPVITSETNPDQDTWYTHNTASFNWKIPSTVTSLRTLFNEHAIATPTITYDNSVTQKTLENLSDGTHYFHLRYVNAAGAGPSAHYKVRIDSTPPTFPTPSIRNDDTGTTVVLKASDETSGVDYYTLQIDNALSLHVSKETLLDGAYKLPVLLGGDHTVFITAHDKARNSAEVTVHISSKALIAPVVSLNTHEIVTGDTIIVSGNTNYPGEQVNVILEKDGDALSKYNQTIAPDGSFSIITDSLKKSGIISVRAEVVFSENVQSPSSEKTYVNVKGNGIVKSILDILYPVASVIGLVILIVLIGLLILGWRKYFLLKSKINFEAKHIAFDMHEAVSLLKKEIDNQLKSLEAVKSGKALHKKEEAVFKEVKKDIDQFELFIKKKIRDMLDSL
ncbi:MAG: hypothetical protein HGA67_00260 [Candidatus Yonathbacteria bacterium]|nr:hypothetical protein [Candidatus Yonathbacteria bacterium]